MLAIMAISSNRIRRILKKEDELDYGLNEVVSIALLTLLLLSETEYHFIVTWSELVHHTWFEDLTG